MTQRSAWSVFPEGLGCCWDACSATDVAQLRAACVEDAALFKPLLVGALAVQLQTCRQRQGRCTAMIALRRFGNAAALSLPELMAALKDFDEQVRRQAALALGSITCKASHSAPVLLHSLRDEVRCVRIAALRALGNLGAEAVIAAVPIAEMLTEEDSSSVREVALQTLGRLAISARPSGRESAKDASLHVTSLITEKLLEALSDEDWCVRKACADSLGSVLNEPHMQDFIETCLPKLLKGLSDDDEDVRAAVAAALGSCAVVAEPALHTLTAALEDRHSEVRAAAAQAFSRLGPAAAAAEPAIVKLLKHEVSGIRETAATVLGLLGLPTAPHLASLAAVLTDESVFVRAAASKTLGQLHDMAAVVLPQVADLLRHPHAGVRQVAVETFCLLRVPLPATTVQELERLAREDCDGSVCEASSEALTVLSVLGQS